MKGICGIETASFWSHDEQQEVHGGSLLFSGEPTSDPPKIYTTHGKVHHFDGIYQENYIVIFYGDLLVLPEGSNIFGGNSDSQITSPVVICFFLGGHDVVETKNKHPMSRRICLELAMIT